MRRLHLKWQHHSSLPVYCAKMRLKQKKKFEDRMLLKKPFLPLVGTKKMTWKGKNCPR